MSEIFEKNGYEITELVRTGSLSARDVVDSHIERIVDYNPELNSFITLSKEEARTRAQELDSRKEKNGRLYGVPIAVKDIIVTKNIRSTGGSKILKDFIPAENATIIDRLLDEGAIIIGKTNCDEFAMGGSNENSAYGVVKNPWDVTRVPGGSSGGSASAVAGGLAPLALGTDTGGSVRQPASFCGIVGLKPTYGRVSRNGLMAMASSLDQAGPLTRSVKDAAILLEIMAGEDPRDATSSREPVPSYSEQLNSDISGMRIGVAREFFVDGMDSDVEKSVRDGIELLKSRGATIVDISLPLVPYALATYYIIMPAEVSANMARYDGIRYGTRKEENDILHTYISSRTEGLGDEVRRRIMIGTYVLSAGYYDAYYAQAQKVRALITRDFKKAFSSVDCIAAPVAPMTAFKIGEKITDPLTLYLTDICTVSANIAGLPAISVPVNPVHGLPVGIQLIGNYFAEQTILNAAYAIESERGFANIAPL